MGKLLCSAYNCKNTSESGVKLFTFPVDERKRLKKWLMNMKWKDWTPSPYSVLCSDHFEEQYIDRTGRFIKLRKDAVPTKFSFPHVETRKVAINPRSRRYQTSTLKASETNPREAPGPPPEVQQSGQTERSTEIIKLFPRWKIIMDDTMMKIDSFPSFFHGDYCIPHAIQWAPDYTLDVEMETKESKNTIMVKEAWWWLGLDVRGPFSPALTGHMYIMTVVDYYSKWVEALPMSQNQSSEITDHIMDIISHFGFPVRILSRLPLYLIEQINQQLREKLRIDFSVVVFHHQAGTLDLASQRSIDRMVTDLTEQHPDDWHVYLPAKVFSLCFQKHEETKELPFSLLHCKAKAPREAPREILFLASQIQRSTFIVE